MYVNKRWLDNPTNQVPETYQSWGCFTKLQNKTFIDQINQIKEINLNKDQLSIDEKKLFIFVERIIITF